MTTELLRLAEVVPEDQRDRVLAMRVVAATEVRAEQAWKALLALVDAYQEGLLWAPLVLEYLLSVHLKVLPVTWSATVLTVLRFLRCRWSKQSCPDVLTKPDLTLWSQSERKNCLLVAYTVEAALWRRQASKRLIPDVRWLMQDEYVRVLGWGNLAPHLPPEILKLAKERSETREGELPDRYQEVIQRLFGFRQQPYIAHLTFAAAALMRERRGTKERTSPHSLLKLISGASSALAGALQTSGLTCVADLESDVHLMAYIQSEVDVVLKNNRAAQVDNYLQCARAQLRWSQTYTRPPQVFLDWHLQQLSDAHAAEVGRLVSNMRQEMQRRRQARVKVVEPYLRPMLHTAVSREEIIRGLHGTYIEAVAAFEAQDERKPLQFSYVLTDRSATLQFRLWTANLLSETDQVLIPQPAERKRPMRNEIITEYVGALDDGGASLPLPFFAKIVRAWYDESARAEFLATGLPKKDFAVGATSTLRPDQSVGIYIHRYTAVVLSKGTTPRILFDLTSICIGLTYAVFILLIALSTGMRIHELQQLRADRAGSKRNDKGEIECLVWTKGQKGEYGIPTIHVIEARFVPYWNRVMKAHNLKWEYFEDILPERGSTYELKEGAYLLQAGGKPLKTLGIGMLLRFLISGIEYQTPDGQSFYVTPHFLRYLYGRTRRALGHSEAEIQEGLGHASKTQSKRYYQGTSEKEDSVQAAGVMTPAGPLTCWEMLTYGSEGRS